MENNKRPVEQGFSGPNHNARFATVEYAENIGGTLRRVLTYFAKEKGLVALMLAVYLIYSASQFLQGLLSARISQRIVKRMREELFGKMMSRMTNDIENISTTVSQSLPSMFSGVLTIIGTVAVMVYYCWQLALLSCATVLLTLLATKILSGKVRKFSRRRQMLLGKLNGTVEEMISGYRTVVAYNHQSAIIQEFCSTADDLTKAGIRTDAFSGVMGPIMNCIGNIGFVIIAAFGGYFAVNGLISVGVISAFIVYAKQFSRPINELAQIYGQLQTAIAGANISQGQRQLLAIARAFVADPDVLILDEATSNVDTRTEKAIQAAMHLIMQDRTSIIITHRLSTIRDADLIVVMDQGRIIESGSHKELLAQRGKYYELYMTQYAGFGT